MGSIIISVAVVAIGVVIGLLRGGRIVGLLDVRPQWPIVLISGFLLLVLTENVAVPQVRSVAVIASFLVLVGLVANSAIRGALITGFGVTLNLAVLVLNGAVPVRFEALREAGLVDAAVQPSDVNAVGHLLELETAETRLGFLGDTIPIGSIDTVISIGDLVTFAGVIVIISNLIAARRRGRISVDDLFAPPTAVDIDLDLEVPAEPTSTPAPAPAPAPAPIGVLDLAGDEPVVDVSEPRHEHTATAHTGRTARVAADDDPYDPDELWADDDTGVRILGPSSNST